MKKKVLITIDWFMPGTKSGGPVRSYMNLIDHLKDDIDFFVVTRDTDYCESEPYNAVKSNSWNDLMPGLSVYYLSKDQTNFRGLSKVLKSQSFDVVFINGVYSWFFSIIPLFILKTHPKIIVSARGMLNPQAFAVKPFKKKVFLKVFKFIGFYKNIQFHATNDFEADQIKKWIGVSAKIKVAPNLARQVTSDFIWKELSSPIRIVNIARIAKEKGTLKALLALKNVKGLVTFDLYGSIYDNTYWSDCLEVINEMPKNISVQYKGVAKSEKIPELLNGYHFFMMLSEGENFGHSILEALSAGVPVLISDKTPWKNLTQKNIGWDVNTDKETEIESVISSWFNMNQEDYDQMSKNAFDYAQEFINDSGVLEENKKLFLP